MSTFRQKVQATTNWVKPDPEDLVEEPGKSVFSALKRPRRDAGAEPVVPVASAASRPATRGRKAVPVTAHRLFPAFAALWFAALFGLGSLAISGEVLGRLVSAIGLPALVPAAAPPLGFTAHLLVAFALAVLGAMLGLALALRLRPTGDAPVRMAPVITPVAPAAASDASDVYKVRARDAHPDAPPRRPLVLTEAFADALGAESGEPELAAPEEPLLRRKPSQLVSESVADSGPWIPEFTPGGLGAVQPLDLAALELAEFDAPGSDASEPDGTEPVEAPFAAPLGAGMGAPFALPIMQPEPELEPEFAADVTPEDPAHALADYPVEPVVESAPEMDADASSADEHEAEDPSAEEPVIDAAPVLIAATPQLPAGYVTALPELPDGSWSPVAGAPLENLGLIQLIERLAVAIAARKAADQALAKPATDDPAALPAVAAIPASGAFPVPEYAYEPEPEAEPEPEFEPGPFSKPQAVADLDDAGVPMGTARAAILRRLGAVPASAGAGGSTYANGSEGAADGVPPFSRPAVVAAPAADEAVVPLHPAADEGSVAADPQADAISAPASSPFEADDALRSALATLQRMSVRS